jgi:hypothetical protein
MTAQGKGNLVRLGHDPSGERYGRCTGVFAGKLCGEGNTCPIGVPDSNDDSVCNHGTLANDDINNAGFRNSQPNASIPHT